LVVLQKKMDRKPRGRGKCPSSPDYKKVQANMRVKLVHNHRKTDESDFPLGGWSDLLGKACERGK
jgi:hypothetical protein